MAELRNSEKTDKRSRKRVVIPIDETGELDTSRLDEKTLSQLRSAVTSSGSQVEVIPPQAIQVLLSGIAGIEAALIAPRFGIDRTTAMSVCVPQGEVMENLVTAGTAVANKHAGRLAAYSDEISLAFALISWQTTVFASLQAIQRDKQEDPVPEVPEDVQ